MSKIDDEVSKAYRMIKAAVEDKKLSIHRRDLERAFGKNSNTNFYRDCLRSLRSKLKVFDYLGLARIYNDKYRIERE